MPRYSLSGRVKDIVVVVVVGTRAVSLPSGGCFFAHVFPRTAQ